MSITYGFLGTYPPTQCGLATFGAALFTHLTSVRGGSRGLVVRVVDGPPQPTHPEVACHLVSGSPRSLKGAVDVLNRCDVVIVQHEYGIYGGVDGDEALVVLEAVKVPVIVVLHTVLSVPTSHQRQVLERIGLAADAVVTMTETAHRRLLDAYQVDPTKVAVIPHGADVVWRPSPATTRHARPTILTWGLLGPGKGIEWGISALHALRDLNPAPRYVVAGQTHPKVVERDGEGYRDGLTALAAKLRVTDLVEFIPGYLDAGELAQLVWQADIVLLPYDSYEQVTSGVLIEAVAGHKPVVSTVFPHARELLGNGAGLLVPHRNGMAIARAVRRVLTEPGLPTRMAAAAARIAPELTWLNVAGRYRQLAAGLLDVQVSSIAG